MLLSQGTEHDGDAERILLEDVQASIENMVEIMQSYRNRGALSKICTSALCKRRQDEAEMAIKSAAQYLEVSGLHSRSWYFREGFQSWVKKKRRFF